MAAAIVMLRRPAWSPLITLAKSSVNILLLVLSVLLPVYRFMGSLSEGPDPAILHRPDWLLNFLLCAGIAVASFHSNTLVIRRS